MNQRRRPQMPPRGPERPQNRPEYYWRRWHHWRRHPYYCHHCYDWDYDQWDNDYDWEYDYDWDHSTAPKPKSPTPQYRPAQNVVIYLKVDPILMANLLSYSFNEVQTEEQIHSMMERMMELNLTHEPMDMSHFDIITGRTTGTTDKE